MDLEVLVNGVKHNAEVALLSERGIMKIFGFVEPRDKICFKEIARCDLHDRSTALSSFISRSAPEHLSQLPQIWLITATSKPTRIETGEEDRYKERWYYFDNRRILERSEFLLRAIGIKAPLADLGDFGWNISKEQTGELIIGQEAQVMDFVKTVYNPRFSPNPRRRLSPLAL